LAKRVILAVAGAGKTYHICHSIQPNKKNLILAYTHENVGNINRELIEAHGHIPELTSVMTFDSFVYRFLVRPYEPTILQHFMCEEFVTKGITLTEPPKQSIQVKPGEYRKNPNYSKKGTLGHYISKRGYYFNAKTKELVLEVKSKANSLIDKATFALNNFYDQVLIDEFQDFRQFDFDLIIALSKRVDNILLVGDYYQHSVSAINNSGKPFVAGIKKVLVSYDDFIESLKSNGFEVDTTTLVKSRRCPPNICKYVTDNLGISIEADNNHVGSVIWLGDNAQTILENDAVTKLVIKESDQYTFKSQNWSYSKGNTFDSACVILTDNCDDLSNGEFKPNKLASSTLNKLYVAMTRTQGDLFLLPFSAFQSMRQKYLKSS